MASEDESVASAAGQPLIAALSASDDEMIRVIDDLVDLLIAKQVLTFTELPLQAQNKLLARKQLRENVNVLRNLIGEEESLI